MQKHDHTWVQVRGRGGVVPGELPLRGMPLDAIQPVVQVAARSLYRSALAIDLLGELRGPKALSLEGVVWQECGIWPLAGVNSVPVHRRARKVDGSEFAEQRVLVGWSQSDQVVDHRLRSLAHGPMGGRPAERRDAAWRRQQPRFHHVVARSGDQGNLQLLRRGRGGLTVRVDAGGQSSRVQQRQPAGRQRRGDLATAFAGGDDRSDSQARQSSARANWKPTAAEVAPGGRSELTASQAS